MAFKLYQIYC